MYSAWYDWMPIIFIKDRMIIVAKGLRVSVVLEVRIEVLVV